MNPQTFIASFVASFVALALFPFAAAAANPTNLNIIAGANTTVAGVNNAGAGRIDITITASGGASLSVSNSTVVGGPLLLASTNLLVDALGTNFVRYTLTANVGLMPPTNGFDGERVIYALTQDGTGTRTAVITNNMSGTQTAFWNFGQEVTGITLSTNAGKTDYISMIYWQASNRWDVLGVGTRY
jgi:hypothetical protein